LAGSPLFLLGGETDEHNANQVGYPGEDTKAFFFNKRPALRQRRTTLLSLGDDSDT
jgi:hypothetical protein